MDYSHGLPIWTIRHCNLVIRVWKRSESGSIYGSVNSKRAQHPSPSICWAFVILFRKATNALWWGQAVHTKTPWWGLKKSANAPPWDNTKITFSRKKAAYAIIIGNLYYRNNLIKMCEPPYANHFKPLVIITLSHEILATLWFSNFSDFSKNR